jgi:putative Mn2+ efflux pump MntP
VTLQTVTRRQTFRLSWHFGLFQALMPVLGWAGGLAVREYFLRFGHWIASGLLLYIGGRTIWEGLSRKDEDSYSDPTKGARLVMLSVATSIDALAVGFSLAMLNVSIWLPAAVIGVVALVFTAAGLHLGKLLGCATRMGQHAEILGGMVLLAIAAKILWQAL